MGTTINGTYIGGISQRRKVALQNLELQLKKGNKMSEGKLIPLEEKDVKRIEKEILTLKAKI
jgi:hypothetical protein